jgi:1-acyl-sn-glycerol-3-phosphate acyltransferase
MRWTPTMRAPSPETDPLRWRSGAWVAFFSWVFERRLRQAFHAVRLAQAGVPEVDPALPLVVYCNHPSWWDAALAPVLTRRLFAQRRSYGPIDAAALQRYPFMRRLGLFGVQANTYAGTATFLRVAQRVLSEPDTLLCMTPEGRFTDARLRPLVLRPGLAAVIAKLPRVTALPLALEYPFWDESRPEALARFGTPIVFDHRHAALDIQPRLTLALTAAMDTLAADACSRDAARFITLLDGRVGVGGVYDGWRRLKAWRRGRRFDASHRQAAAQPHP